MLCFPQPKLSFSFLKALDLREQILKENRTVDGEVVPGPVEMCSPSQAESLSTVPSQTPLRMFAAQSGMCFSNSSAIMNCLLKTSHESKRAALGTTD